MTVEALSFKDHQPELVELGAAVFDLSTQTTEYQREMAGRLHLPFAVLSNEGLAPAMRRPIMEVEGRILLKRLTMVLRDGVVAHVFHPVFLPNEAAREVLEWPRGSAGAA